MPLARRECAGEEKRAELFLDHDLAEVAAKGWRVEAGGRYETSRLTQSGDSSLVKSLAFLKPRMLARWSPSKSNEIRFLVESARSASSISAISSVRPR